MPSYLRVGGIHAPGVAGPSRYQAGGTVIERDVVHNHPHGAVGQDADGHIVRWASISHAKNWPVGIRVEIDVALGAPRLVTSHAGTYGCAAEVLGGAVESRRIGALAGNERGVEGHRAHAAPGIGAPGGGEVVLEPVVIHRPREHGAMGQGRGQAEDSKDELQGTTSITLSAVMLSIGTSTPSTDTTTRSQSQSRRTMVPVLPWTALLVARLRNTTVWPTW